MKPRVTSHDVARLAGVSRTTVSAVLNDTLTVVLSAETRKRVREAAAELGYRPNSAARMLVRGDTETIGLVITDPSILPVDGFIPQLLHGIQQVNRRHGFHVLIEGLAAGQGETTYQGLVEARRIDGLIVLNPVAADGSLAGLVERSVPLVLVGTIGHPDEFSVRHSTAAGMEAVVAHLIELGHRRIGTVPFAVPGSAGGDGRLATIRAALATHGLTLDDRDIEYGDYSAESGNHAARRLLERRPDLTAVVAGNDTIALGVIGAAAALGRSVPGDLSVVGFDDLPFAAWGSPALTTVRVDAVRQGIEAAEMLVRVLRGLPVEQRQMLLDAELVVRQSTGPAR